MVREVQPYWLSVKEGARGQGKSEVSAAAKSIQSCPTLCDSTEGSPPGSPIPGMLQARTLEWVAISFSNSGKLKVKVKSLSHVRLPATPWTAAHQAPPSMGFSRQEYWRGVPLLEAGKGKEFGVSQRQFIKEAALATSCISALKTHVGLRICGIVR